MLKPISPIDKFLSKKLRQIRVESGMSQEELGELAGLTFQQIQKYETAKNRIPASRLFEFSQILQKPISQFFEKISADRMYYNYDFEEEKKLAIKSKQFRQDLQNLTAAFSQIEDELVRKHLILIAKDLAAQKRKKVKHQYS
jgi:transcriptional regulator with XRE-family HTH domain